MEELEDDFGYYIFVILFLFGGYRSLVLQIFKYGNSLVRLHEMEVTVGEDGAFGCVFAIFCSIVIILVIAIRNSDF